ncbi:MAG: capsular biosynthesis protein [Alphaproteobacteria bacterium]|nr:capsular biosynthesis protein [Alphaproteobacteria bacterium]
MLQGKVLPAEAIECLEEQEEQWLTRQDATPEKLQNFEKIYGPKAIRNMIICDRQAGAGFVTCAEREDSKLARATRKPDTLNAYTLGMLEYTNAFFDRHKPDALFAYVIASGPMLAFALEAERRGIFFSRLQHTRIEDCTVMDTDIKGMLAPVWTRFKTGEKPSPEAQQKGAAWLQNFREKNREPDYMALLKTQSKKAMSTKGIILGVAKAAARGLLYNVIKKDKPIRASSGWQGFRQSITIPYKSWRLSQRDDYARLDDLKNTPYLYFPLHVDPEASTMLLAPDFTNQISVIEAISKSMPSSLQLFVKEHPNMNGRRPNGFYDAIAALPSVRLVDPTITGRDALALSKGVVTITGTAGWEAALLGKPSVILGDAHFRQFDSAEFCPELSHLEEAIITSFHRAPLSDAELARFLGLIFEESFALPSSIAWASEGKPMAEKDRPIITAMADHFERRLKEHKQPGSKAA